MSASIENIKESDRARRKIFIIVAVVALPVILALAYFAMRSSSQGSAPARLEGAIRPGSPEFDAVRDRIVVDYKGDDSDDAVEGARALGDIVMTLKPTIRNFTGRTLTGLEVRGAVLDPGSNVIRERTVIAVPNPARGMTELDNNKSVQVPIIIEGFKQSDVRAKTKVEVTGVKFK